MWIQLVDKYEELKAVGVFRKSDSIFYSTTRKKLNVCVCMCIFVTVSLINNSVTILFSLELP